MSTFLLTWNPARWHWANLVEVSRQTAEGIPYASRWSTGNTKKITRGDRVFLLKQGEAPRGIIAAGWVTSEEVYKAPHYDAQRAAQGDTALRADVEFERIVNPAEDAPLSVETIASGALANVYWQTPASGIELPEDAASELEALWAGHLEGIDGPVYLDADEAEGSAEEGGAQEPFVPHCGAPSPAVSQSSPSDYTNSLLVVTAGVDEARSHSWILRLRSHDTATTRMRAGDTRSRAHSPLSFVRPR